MVCKPTLRKRVKYLIIVQPAKTIAERRESDTFLNKVRYVAITIQKNSPIIFAFLTTIQFKKYLLNEILHNETKFNTTAPEIRVVFFEKRM
jgi:hypothetical protein